MSQGIDRTEVRRIAALAHLALSEEEASIYARQLQEILAYAEQVLQVATEGVGATAHVGADALPERLDVVQPSLPVDEALGNAPGRGAANLFTVPRVIGE
jgi:aspartyl-tRNA(Asn)/glutamyl-tRNA(Gln) amidotransferase subunit C